MQLKKYIKINNYLKDKTRNKKEYINKYLNRNEVKKKWRWWATSICPRFNIYIYIKKKPRCARSRKSSPAPDFFIKRGWHVIGFSFFLANRNTNSVNDRFFNNGMVLLRTWEDYSGQQIAPYYYYYYYYYLFWTRLLYVIRRFYLWVSGIYQRQSYKL
jgi:hypothetical protein